MALVGGLDWSVGIGCTGGCPQGRAITRTDQGARVLDLRPGNITGDLRNSRRARNTGTKLMQTTLIAGGTGDRGRGIWGGPLNGLKPFSPADEAQVDSVLYEIERVRETLAE